MESSTGAGDKIQLLQKQIEFYFSDSNWVRDQWMKNEAAKNAEQFINSELFQQFPKIKNMNVTNEEIKQAISSSSQLIPSADGKMVRRKNPPPTEESIIQKSVYVTGMPEAITQEEVIQALSGNNCTVVCVWLRKSPAGSAFVELSSPEDVEKIVKLSESQGVQIKGKTIKIAKRHVGNERKDKRKRNDKDEDGPQVTLKERVPTPDTGSDLPSLTKGSHPQGVVVKIQQVPIVAAENDVGAMMGFYGTVKNVTIERGGSSFVRFENSSDAQKAVEDIRKNRKQKVIYSKELDVELLSGEQEIKYWDQVISNKEAKQMEGSDAKKPKTS